jgi:hypothetical protein
MANPVIIERALTTTGLFGLLLTDGTLVGISHIDATNNYGGSLWLDVELLSATSPEMQLLKANGYVVQGAASPQLKASINILGVAGVFQFQPT